MDFPSLLAAADRAALARLGGVIRYVASTGDENEVQGVFDNAAANATVLGQEVVSAGPRVFFLLDDLPSDPETEPKGFPKFVIDAVTYVARDVRKDGKGGVLVELSEVDA